MTRYAPPARSYHGTTYVPAVLMTVEPFGLDGKRLHHVRLTVRWATAESVAKTLAGTVGNKAGYGSAEAAQRIARCCATLIENGVDTTYDTMSWASSTAGIALEWQESSSRDHYCGKPSIHADGSSDSINEWEARVGLYRWLEKLAGGRMDDPRDLLLALQKRKAIPLLSWRERERRYGEYTGGGGWVAGSWQEMLDLLPVAAREDRAAG